MIRASLLFEVLKPGHAFIALVSLSLVLDAYGRVLEVGELKLGLLLEPLGFQVHQVG